MNFYPTQKPKLSKNQNCQKIKIFQKSKLSKNQNLPKIKIIQKSKLSKNQTTDTTFNFGTLSQKFLSQFFCPNIFCPNICCPKICCPKIFSQNFLGQNFLSLNLLFQNLLFQNFLGCGFNQVHWSSFMTQYIIVEPSLLTQSVSQLLRPLFLPPCAQWDMASTRFPGLVLHTLANCDKFAPPVTGSTDT